MTENHVTSVKGELRRESSEFSELNVFL